MALEQFDAWVRGADQSTLGPTATIGLDRFQMLSGSELHAEHELISEYFEQYRAAIGSVHHGVDFDCPALAKMNALKPGPSAALVLAMVERIFWDEAFAPKEYDPTRFGLNYGALDRIMIGLIERADAAYIRKPLLRWISHRSSYYYIIGALRALLGRIDSPSDAEEIALLERVYASLTDEARMSGGAEALARTKQLLGSGHWREVLSPSEPWARAAAEELESIKPDPRTAWRALLEHCLLAKSANPTAKWTKTALKLLDAVGVADFRERVVRWFSLVDKADSHRYMRPSWDAVDKSQRIHDRNADALRGLLWLCPAADSPQLQRAITTLAISAYRKIAGLGPRAVKVGNAALWAFGAIGTVEAVGQLAVLKVRVKFGTAQKLIEKALVATAQKAGIPREDLEEMAVPAYGLTEVGMRTEVLGEITARLSVDGKKVELQWTRADGKSQASVPKTVKDGYAEDLKELKAAAKDIERMLPAQAARIEGAWLTQKRWAYGVWRDRYLDHPLVGTIVRRLIWKIGKDSAIALDGRLVNASDKPIKPATDATVSLWHPLEEPEAEVLTWREWLVKHSIRQPFKQAHREVYLLTDAERRTATYSNRFAGHIVKQHQFNSLAAARGWKHKLRLMVDDEYPPAHVEIPSLGYRAELWVQGAGDAYGVDTNDSGAFLRLSTDQVRFYRHAAPLNHAHAGGGGYEMRAPDEGPNHPVALRDIPPLLLSEVLRDVDLFVGVASIGNDPTWSDGGPEGRYREYWNNYAFGELSATALTRKAMLERLLPKLKIADACKLSEKWLAVRGSLRNYKIHLGSGNIMMEPNDQYLCIVQSQSAVGKAESVFLPYDGDGMFSVILSKAFLLANDKAITDPTILSQINRKS